MGTPLSLFEPDASEITQGRMVKQEKMVGAYLPLGLLPRRRNALSVSVVWSVEPSRQWGD